LGPPDGATSRPDVFTNDALTPRPFCAPLSEAEQADYADRVARRDPGLVRWYPPMGLAQVARAQRAAAELEGAAYWDWSARMGGPCSSHALVTADPPRMRSDHLHFNSEGGAWIGDLLFADLMATAPAVAGAR
ncbi:MAG TPA: hypothetical protein VGB49_06060, partial [Caulobacteraceae bacterium]